MTPTLLLLTIAAAAAIAFLTSALVGVGLLFGDRLLERRTPAARARLLLGVALIPALATAGLMTAALAPFFGWIADHCAVSGDVHSHPHLCLHHDDILPALPILALASLFVARGATACARLSTLIHRSLSTQRALVRQAHGAGPDGSHLLPLDEPRAFVIGLFRPKMFVTRGLLTPRHRRHMHAVLAHERAHLTRGDPLRRVIAKVALAFHLPFIADAIEQRLARSHEMAADEDAATVIGSRAGVAQALVDLARARPPTPFGTQGFADSDVELRVRSLLDVRSKKAGPHSPMLIGLAALGFVVIASGASTVHHGIEMLLGVLERLVS